MSSTADTAQPTEGPERVNAPAFWEERYQLGETGWDMGRPAEALLAWLREPAAPPPGRKVAVLGAGAGHDALAFARAGHAVIGFDFAPSAVARARARAEAAGVSARFEQADIFALPPDYAGTFDLVVEDAFLTAIAPNRRAEYARVVHDLLRPGGLLVGLFLVAPREGGPPFSTTRAEVERLFADLTPEYWAPAMRNPEANAPDDWALAVLRRP